MIFSLRRWSSLIHAGFPVSRATRVPARPPSRFRIRGYHPLWPDFPVCSATLPDDLYCRPHYPKHLNLSTRFRLLPFRSPLLRESLLLSFPPGTEMFHFPGFASYTYRYRMTGVLTSRVAPFGHPRITACLAAPRGLSQLTTSFFAPHCLGIHRMPLVA